jgi:hypothetical protein
MTRQEFIAEAKRRGKSKEETRAKYDELDASGAFDDSTNKSPASPAQPSAAPAAPEQSPYDKFGIPGMIFPRTSESAEKGGNFGARTLSALGDIFTLPQRAVAGGAAMAGFNFSAPQSTPYSEGLKVGAQEFSRFKPTEDTKGITKFAQDVAYDPTLVPGLLTGATEAKLAMKAPGLLKAAIPAVSGAIQAGSSSAIQQATEGSVDAKETGIAAGLGAALPAAAAGGAAALKKVTGDTGKRLIQALIRPGQKGMKEGFDADYIMNDKEILDAAAGGIESLQGALKERFNSLAGQVRQIQSTAGQNVNVDVPAVYMRTVRKLKGSNDYTGMKRELIDALDGLQDNLNNQVEFFDEFTDLATAMKLRTNYGTKVNWQPGISSGGRKAAMGAGAEEKVYDAFYKELSAEIKKQAPDAIRAIDEEFTKLIPVLKATNRRVLVETSNLPAGLMESIGGVGVGATTAMTGEGDLGDRVKRGLVGATIGAAGAKAIKSPRTGAALSNLSKSIGVPPAVLTTSPVNALRENLDEDPYEKLKKEIQRKGSYR